MHDHLHSTPKREELPLDTIRQQLKWSPPYVYSQPPPPSAHAAIDAYALQKEIRVRVRDWLGFKESVDSSEADLLHDLRQVRYERASRLSPSVFTPSECVVDTYAIPACHIIDCALPMAHDPSLQLYSVSKNLESGGDVTFLQVYLESDMLGPIQRWAPPHRRISNWRFERKSLLVMAFVRRGTLHLNDFQPGEALRSHAGTIEAFQLLQDKLIETQSAYALLSDELSCVAWHSLREHPASVCLASITHNDCSLRAILTNLMRRELIEIRLWPPMKLPWDRPYQGALPAADNFTANNEEPSPQRFSDFDFFTMQRRRSAMKTFKEWWLAARKEALLQPIKLGDKLTIVPNAVEVKRLVCHRSPYPCIPLPPETEAIVTRHPRKVSLRARSMLSAPSRIVMEVVEVKRAEVNTYSQVFIVRLEGCDELLCLKLYDERMFDIYDDLRFWDMHEPTESLSHVVCSDDLIKRELGVYERLQNLQGSLLPHSYGVHLITLPSGWQCYGFLMEALQGPTLAEVDAWHDLPMHVQKDMATRIRHGVTALCYAQVDQQDWHANQFICLPPDDATGRDWEIVFIDFAFAFMPLGEGGISHRSTGELRFKLFGHLRAEAIMQYSFNLSEDECC